MHESLIPPPKVKKNNFDRDTTEWKTEFDILDTLKKLGHDVNPVGVISDLKVIKDKIDQFNPHIIFNLLEEFDGEAVYDQNVVSYLELLKIPYTGCNPKGLILSREKSLAKKIMTYHRIATPKFLVFPKSKEIKSPKNLNFPLIIKCLNEEASFGISQASIVHSFDKLVERVKFIHEKLFDHAIAEEFIVGREFSVGVLGNQRLKVFPVWELFFNKASNPEKEIYSNRAKFNPAYRKRKGINDKRAVLSPDVETRFKNICKKAYRVLNLSGYARVDLRMDEAGKIYIIEVNPNPDISFDDEFAKAARVINLPYDELINKILSLGLTWHKKDKW